MVDMRISMQQNGFAYRLTLILKEIFKGITIYNLLPYS